MGYLLGTGQLKFEKSLLLSEYERVMQGIRQAVFGGWTCRERYEGADTKTKNAIMEEVFVDHVSHIIDGLIKMRHKDIDIEKVMEDSPHTREEIMKMVLEIRDRVNVKRLEEEDFWDDINID